MKIIQEAIANIMETFRVHCNDTVQKIRNKFSQK
jgi:hypothetical protein